MSYEGLLNQTITLARRSGHDRYGKESVGSGTDHSARVQQVSRARFHYSSDGTDATSYVVSLLVFLKSSVVISEGDKITYDSVDYRVDSVSPKIDGNGNTHHKTIECVKWNI